MKMHWRCYTNLSKNRIEVSNLEDDEQLDGKWDKAMVVATSRGWSADKAVFGYLLGK